MKKLRNLIIILLIFLFGLSFYKKEEKLEGLTIYSNFWESVILNHRSGKILRTGKIISHDTFDLNGDGTMEFGMICRKFRRGGVVKILTLDHYMTEVFSKDLGEIRPWKIEFGDVTGDGKGEIALGIVKKTPLHPEMEKRCFFYNLDFQRKKFIPRYRASRFSRPFTDYALYDLTKDGQCEVIAIEKTENEKNILAAYRWHGFGFFLEYEGMENQRLVEMKKDKGDLFVDGEKIILHKNKIERKGEE
ncbi:MAG: hypothetical protein Q4Q07_06220 [Tissierellia bacterium]|nr:hypothetical protein [Tissierellia bacterium]